MASGVPVLTSNRSAMPEVVAETALLAKPNDLDELSQGLERVLSGEEYREKAIPLGNAHAGNFGWETGVNETVDVYKAAFGHKDKVHII